MPKILVVNLGVMNSVQTQLPCYVYGAQGSLVGQGPEQGEIRVRGSSYAGTLHSSIEGEERNPTIHCARVCSYLVCMYKKNTVNN